MAFRFPRAQRPTKIAAVVAKEIAAVLPTIATHIQASIQTPTPITSCTFKHFKSVSPPIFNGTEGASSLLKWFEEMENAFTDADCPDDLKVRRAAAYLRDHALAWWNSEKLHRGTEKSLDMDWDEFKDIMSEEYCPIDEVENLEREFWNLKQEGGDNKTYTRRFNELRKLIPHHAPDSRAVRLYIRGLPKQIRDIVRGNEPATLKSATRLAAQLSADNIRDGTFPKEGSKTSAEKTPIVSKTESTDQHNKKRKSNLYNYTMVTSATPISQIAPQNHLPKKQYAGKYPLCNNCQRHHLADIPCRLCTSCGRYGHFADQCRSVPTVPQPLALPAIQQTQTRNQYGVCFNCGDPTHYRNTCPRLVNIINTQAQANPTVQVQAPRGRAFAITAAPAQTDDQVINGTLQ